MPSSNRARLFPELANQKWTLWAAHEAVHNTGWRGYPMGWLPIRTGMRHQVAIDELVQRQHVCRKREEPVEFKLLPDGELPPPKKAPVKKKAAAKRAPAKR